MLPALQHYVSSAADPHSRNVYNAQEARFIPKRQQQQFATQPIEPPAYSINSRAFELYSPVNAPSAVDTEQAIHARSILAPVYAHNTAVTKYLRTSSQPADGHEARSRGLDIVV